MAKYPTTNIVYSGMEDKGGPTVTILDEKKNKWTIWKANYENKELDSDAYRILKSFQIGESFGVEYGEKQESFVGRDGKTVNFTKRTIYNILPLVANPAPTPNSSALVETARGEAATHSQGGSRDFDKEAIGKCQSLFLAAYLQAGNKFSDALLQVGQAKRLAEQVVYGKTEKVAPDIQETAEQMASELPTIQQGEDISVEDIPY